MQNSISAVTIKYHVYEIFLITVSSILQFQNKMGMLNNNKNNKSKNVKVKAVCGSYSTAALRHIVLLPE